MNIDILQLRNYFQSLTTDALIHIFVFFVLFDILTGITKSLLGRQTNSTKGLKGVIKHALVVVLVLFTYPYLNMFNLEWAAISFVIFFITVYGISITENLSEIGIPLPIFIKRTLIKLNELSNQGKTRDIE